MRSTDSVPATPIIDELYQRLDGQQMWYCKHVWHARVDSVVRSSDGNWIQLRLAGPVDFDMILHLGTSADAADVLRALRLWLEDPRIDEDARTAPLARRDVRVRGYDAHFRVSTETRATRIFPSGNVLSARAADAG